MIISHRHRFIFFAVPKTATHTIRQALRQHLGTDDWEQQVLYGKQYLPIAAIARIGHGHISAEEIRPHLDPDVWRDYFKFAFVRNPFDRFISTCFFLNRDNPGFASNAVANMKERLGRPPFRERVLVRPQYQQLCVDDKRIALDYTARFEDLQSGYNEICDRLGLARTDLAKKNQSEHAAFQEYYDDELRSQVAEFYAEDLRLFDYAFPS